MTLFTLSLHLLVFLQQFAVGTPSPLNEQHTLSDIDGTISNAHHDVRKALRDAEIIPTVIDDFTPSLFLAATWSSSHHACAKLGNDLGPSKLKSAPLVTLTAPKPSNWKKAVTYVVTMTDPDAPSRDDPKWSEFCHWIAVGASTASDNCVDTTFSEEIVEYKPPSPPEKTGKHRYVLLAFAPANGTTEKLHLSKPSGRKHWGYDIDNDGDKETKGVKQWAAENGLVPVAANFFYAKNTKQ
ncbi:putative carboxypeptidase Y inhibitor [Triangularia setosa]|uniref:Carboxypeptidase Y inhibitor n=1 Tax=Triangularia setosa TaxID=2587417 RepID=A0AAN7ACF4_9PEZI|nr:putative carboxypeptidase Y inhibitor [Podospora setosa]